MPQQILYRDFLEVFITFFRHSKEFLIKGVVLKKGTLSKKALHKNVKSHNRIK